MMSEKGRPKDTIREYFLAQQKQKPFDQWEGHDVSHDL